MQLLTGKEITNHLPLAATIGFFDGVHQGHQHLIQQVIADAKSRQLTSAVITFDEHPRKVVKPDYTPQLLTSFEERVELIRQTGIDLCIVLQFTPELAQLTAREFINQVLKNRLSVQSLIIGYDHKFGKDRSEDYDDYVRYSRELGLNTFKADVLQIDNRNVSSSYIRESITEGRIAEANQLLNRPYSLRGTVVMGQQLGRTIGFPTANIQPLNSEKAIPANGVYAVRATVNGISHAAMLNIGVRPTVSTDLVKSIEANLFDFAEDIYGQEIEVEFIARLRDERRMNGLDDLKKQLAADKLQALALLV